MTQAASTTTSGAEMEAGGAGPSEAFDAPELARLPPEFVRTLSAEQRALLREALPGRAWRRHPVDLRFSVPWFGRGLFMTLIAGTEKRSEDRRMADRARYPLHRVGNLLFLGGLAALLYALVVTGAVLADGIPLGG
ncbi:hypothetical protein C882_3181 [Caenispirillum salinarum AK4]|uniref:Uncharacterized protein n=1 Tax=Caenispirillum salinarum AK4 TaxID=1238182 RepID=K9H3J9_9PROT|nr:hypothetical protein [Caenispirillum salinarum]EKV32117.1 hypothetical protein C882_3181 [Caenispirillum salinarum AK4]